jgi:hypothetical protein
MAANEFQLEAGSTVIKILDHWEYIDFLESYGIVADDLYQVNKFTYASLPEGSHGKFLIKASDVASLQPGTFGVKLVINTFEHLNLCVDSFTYVDVPIQAWGHTQDRLAIVSVVDLWYSLHQPITKDYNRITTFLPINTSNKFEPVEGSLQTIQVIIEDMRTNIIGAGMAVSLSGFPADGKLKNILSGSTSFKDYMQYLADAHFLVCFMDHATAFPGTMIFSDTVQSAFPVTFNETLYNKYGSDFLTAQLTIQFSTQTHHYTRNRTTVLKPYYDNIDGEWPHRNTAPSAVNDSSLSNNARITGPSYVGHYYPFQDPTDFDSANSTLNAFVTQLSTNFAKRTVRNVDMVFKEIHVFKPSLSIQKIEYTYTRIGFTTRIVTLPPRNISPSPEVNHIARGMEYVPPYMAGLVIGASANPTGSYIPGATATVALPDLGNGVLGVPVFNESTQRMFEGDSAMVQFNLHRRKLCFADKSERLFRFQLTSVFSTGVGLGTRKDIDGTSSGVIETILDPLNKFEHMQVGDEGYMIYTYDNEFVAILPTQGGGGGTFEYVIKTMVTASEGPYTGLRVATVDIMGVPCGREALLYTEAEVVDHAGCYFDFPDIAYVEGYTGQAAEGRFYSLDPLKEACDELTPCHLFATNICCEPNTGVYAPPCEEEEPPP